MDSGLQHENIGTKRSEPLSSDSFAPLKFSSSITSFIKLIHKSNESSQPLNADERIYPRLTEHHDLKSLKRSVGSMHSQPGHYGCQIHVLAAIH
jgi:hypothetical protein